MKLTIAFLFIIGTIIQIVQSEVIETNKDTVTINTPDIPETAKNILHKTEDDMSKGYDWTKDKINDVSEDIHNAGIKAKEYADRALERSKIYADHFLERSKLYADRFLERSKMYAQHFIDKMYEANAQAKKHIDDYVDKTKDYATDAIRKMLLKKAMEEGKDSLSYISDKVI